MLGMAKCVTPSHGSLRRLSIAPRQVGLSSTLYAAIVEKNMIEDLDVNPHHYPSHYRGDDIEHGACCAIAIVDNLVNSRQHECHHKSKKRRDDLSDGRRRQRSAPPV